MDWIFQTLLIWRCQGEHKVRRYGVKFGLALRVLVLPSAGIAFDISSLRLEVTIVPNDVLVIVVLPQLSDKWGPSQLPDTVNVPCRALTLECLDDVAKRDFLPNGASIMQGKDSMQMIGHDHESIEDYGWKSPSERKPQILHCLARRIQDHDPIIDVAESGFACGQAQGYEVGSRIGVVEGR
jgi:hypothetical protein